MAEISLSTQQMKKVVMFQIFLFILLHWSELNISLWLSWRADSDKKMLLFVGKVSQYLKWIADAVSSAVTGKNNTGFTRCTGKESVISCKCTALGLASLLWDLPTLLNIFIFTAECEAGIYYYFCLIGQELPQPKLTEDSFGRAISDDAPTSPAFFPLPHYQKAALWVQVFCHLLPQIPQPLLKQSSTAVTCCQEHMTLAKGSSNAVKIITSNKIQAFSLNWVLLLSLPSSMTEVEERRSASLYQLRSSPFSHTVAGLNAYSFINTLTCFFLFSYRIPLISIIQLFWSCFFLECCLNSYNWEDFSCFSAPEKDVRK